jgi:hypothetical protein
MWRCLALSGVLLACGPPPRGDGTSDARVGDAHDSSDSGGTSDGPGGTGDGGSGSDGGNGSDAMDAGNVVYTDAPAGARRRSGVGLRRCGSPERALARTSRQLHGFVPGRHLGRAEVGLGVDTGSCMSVLVSGDAFSISLPARCRIR